MGLPFTVAAQRMAIWISAICHCHHRRGYMAWWNWKICVRASSHNCLRSGGDMSGFICSTSANQPTQSLGGAAGTSRPDSWRGISWWDGQWALRQTPPPHLLQVCIEGKKYRHQAEVYGGIYNVCGFAFIYSVPSTQTSQAASQHTHPLTQAYTHLNWPVESSCGNNFSGDDFWSFFCMTPSISFEVGQSEACLRM